MFFDSERLDFFRPLSGRHRAVVVASLCALYERLHGPSRDDAQNFSREDLRELLLPVLRESRWQPALPEFGADADNVLNFLRESLGMQLICAMPTKHAGAIKPEFCREWSLSRTEAQGNGEAGFVSEVDERELRS